MNRMSVSLQVVLAIVAVAVLLTGCSQQKVAGTQENASTITATINNNGLTLGSTQVPAGNVVLSIKNSTGDMHTVRVVGPGKTRQSVGVQPNSTASMTLSNAKSGNYVVLVVDLQNQRNNIKRFYVVAPQ